MDGARKGEGDKGRRTSVGMAPCGEKRERLIKSM